MVSGRLVFHRVRNGLLTPTVGEWLCLIIFAVAAWQAKWVSDDGYIYLVYVQNLVDLGEGAVFNSGERVESFTSALWLLIVTMGALIVPRSLVALPDLAVLFGLVLSMIAAALWIPIERAARRPHVGPGTAAVLNAPLAIVAGVYVFRTFATSGLETSLLLVWLGVTVLTIYARTPKLLTLAALSGIAPLVRPELGLISVVLGVLIVVASRRVGTDWRRVLAMAALFVGPMLAATVVRLIYFAQLAPNTYYAKTDTGHGIEEGLDYLADVTSVYGLPLLLLVTVGVLVAGWPVSARQTDKIGPAGEPVTVRDNQEEFDRWRTEARLVLLGLAMISALYVVWIGGDFMHGRFWITPWVFLLGALAGSGSDSLQWVVHRRSSVGRAQAFVGVVAALAVTAVHLPLQPAQARMVESGSGTIDGIVDEGRYYASRNENLHRWGAPNVSVLHERGETLAELSLLLDREIGIAQGSIGQIAFAAQQRGNVYVYDLLGLTQLAGSRVEALPGARVGHGRVPPAVLVAAEPVCRRLVRKRPGLATRGSLV